jgi:tetratricopeptide (TPR) repeat protein
MFEQLGPEHERALTGSLFGLARLYRTLVEYRKAEPVMKEVMRRVESSKIKPDDYGLMIAELGEIAWNEGNLPKADQFYQQAIKESVDRHGSVHREVAYLLDRHAELLERMSQSKRANGLRKEAQVIREKTL